MLKRYTSHKTVEAAQIIAIGNYAEKDGAVVRPVTVEGGITFACPQDMFARYVPVPGDFYVVYRDGYKSFSPRQAFLDGYTLEGESFADIKRGLRVNPSGTAAGNNTGDGVALMTTSHPSPGDPDGQADNSSS